MSHRVIDAIKRWYNETDHPLRFLVPRVLWVLAGVAVACLLVWAFVLALHQADGTKASILATIGTGGALLLISARALRLDVLRFFRSKEPFLGVMWKEPGMYPLTEHEAHTPQDIYAEYILWNAGAAPILVQQPASVITREFHTHHFSQSRTELLRSTGNMCVPEKAFPIILAPQETAIWRYYTGERARMCPVMSGIVTHNRAKAISFIRDSEGDRRFVFEIVYFTALPANVQQKDLRRCYVGFVYTTPVEKAEADHG